MFDEKALFFRVAADHNFGLMQPEGLHVVKLENVDLFEGDLFLAQLSGDDAKAGKNDFKVSRTPSAQRQCNMMWPSATLSEFWGRFLGEPRLKLIVQDVRLLHAAFQASMLYTSGQERVTGRFLMKEVYGQL